MALRTANIIGSGPNGLAAAITLAERGVSVTVYERNRTIGGACATGEVTLPGFHHDLGSSVYPLGVASPFFTDPRRAGALAQHGLRWVQPPCPLAHPLDGGRAITLEHSLDATAAHFAALGTADGRHDARTWRALFAPHVRDWHQIVADFTRPLLRVPSHPVAMGIFGTAALWPAQALARTVFRTEEARAVFAGCAAHSVLPLTRVASAATALVLGTAAHTTGWPLAAGGAGSLTAAMAAYLRSLGGRIETGVNIGALSQVPPADVTLFDTTASALSRIAGSALTPAFRTRLRHFRRGPGIFKIDYALRAPIPWANAACARAATVHVGGTLQEIARSEYAAFHRQPCDRPFVLLVQPSLFDTSRAPLDGAGRQQHTAWAYCHVPAGSTRNMTAAIERQIERFAPGFRDVVLARQTSDANQLTAWNPNLAGGDVSGGSMTLTQLVARPTLRAYRTSNARVYLGSSATPPGGGVHGMAGHNAALAAWHDHS